MTDDTESVFKDYSTPINSTNEWGTPHWIVRRFENHLGEFDVDPCSGCEPEPIADTRFTEEDDGLSQSWFGNVWVNPPYSDIGPWLEKSYTETTVGDAQTVVCLIPVRTSTDWFHDWATKADVLVFINNRLSYLTSEGAKSRATFASMLCIYGDVPESVLTLCIELGFTVTDSGAYSATEQATLEATLD